MSQHQQRFEYLVHALSADLYRYALWLCRNPALAEDLVQETFARAWHRFDHLQDEKAAKAWLITILRREHARLYERPRPLCDDIDDMELSDHGPTPEQHHESRLLHQAIGHLEPEYREPLVLQVLSGFSTAEIASIMNTNHNTVLTRLHRARLKLKAWLENTPVKRGNYNG